jgi:predicted MPP superfamily phosphohydrolase
MSTAFLTGFSAALHFYIAARLVPELATPWAIALALLLAASALLVPAALALRRRRGSPAADRVANAGLFFLGLFSSLLVATFLRDIVLILAALVALAAPGWFRFEDLERVTAQVVPIAALFASTVGLWNARRIARVVHVDVPIAGLPPALHGFSIVQLSDVHVGPTIRRDYVEGIVAAVNGLQADVVAITGDLVDGSVPELREHVAPLAQLAARHGLFFVTGNHEYYSGALAWMAELERMGLKVLHNQHVVIEQGGAKLVIAGVPDFGAGHYLREHASDPQAALAGAPADAIARVLLAHQPRSAPAAARAGFDLQLSGHTHGGQFLPWNFFVRLQQPFTAGLHRLDELWVYVSRGTGYWGPPKRFGAPSEITKLRLIPASA